MIDKLIEKFYTRLPNKKAQSVILHSLFWTVWLTRSFYDTFGLWGVEWGLAYIIIVFLSQAPLVYIHLYLYVPKLLNQKKYFSYFAIMDIHF